MESTYEEQSTGLLGNSNDKDINRHTESSSLRRQGRDIARYIGISIIMCLACWGAFDGLRRLVSLIPSKSEHHPCWCGTSDAEAVALGCRYDHLSVDWLPENCIDQDLVEEFDKSGPGRDGSWQYYLQNTTSAGNAYYYRVSNWTDIDDFARHGVDHYTTTEWHIAHCMFVWRKQFRAGFDGRAIEPWNNKEEHIKHCTKYMMDAVRDQVSLDSISTTIHGTDRHTDE